MSEPVYFSDHQDEAMEQAYAAAQASFKYFWRELSWENRRIVPALDLAMIKLPFTDGPRSDGNPDFEQMWVEEVDFDGLELSGTLMNEPNWLTSVRKGDAVRALFAQLSDWMMTADGKVYGAYTVNLMRARMGARERKAHDQAWGLDFGDPSDIRIERWREEGSKRGLLSRMFGGTATAAPGAEAPAGFVDHPMCVNMLPKIEEQLQQDASIATATDERGWTLLHSEALAGNFGVVKLLVRYGADVAATTPDGRTAAALARGIGWNEIGDYLSR